MNKQLIYEIIKVICTAIITIAGILLTQSCTVALSISRNNTNSNQSTEQVVKMDSTSIAPTNNF